MPEDAPRVQSGCNLHLKSAKGIESSRPEGVADFESGASASSATHIGRIPQGLSLSLRLVKPQRTQ